MRSSISRVYSAGSRTRPSSMPRKITLSVVGTRSSTGVVPVRATGAAGVGAAIGPGRNDSGRVVVVVVVVELVVVVVVEVLAVVVDDAAAVLVVEVVASRRVAARPADASLVVASASA